MAWLGRRPRRPGRGGGEAREALGDGGEAGGAMGDDGGAAQIRNAQVLEEGGGRRDI